MSSHAEMSDLTVLHKATIRVSLLANDVDVDVTIMTTYTTILSFTFLRQPYTFNVTKWRSRGQLQFMQLFHEVPRDRTMFGSISDDEVITATLDQRIGMVMEAIRDIFRCFDRILATHQRAILDYAVWYREQPNTLDTYSKYITMITCHCIVHTNFMNPSIQWTRVEL